MKFQHLLALFCDCNMRENFKFASSYLEITGSYFEIAGGNIGSVMKEEFYLDNAAKNE